MTSRPVETTEVALDSRSLRASAVFGMGAVTGLAGLLHVGSLADVAADGLDVRLTTTGTGPVLVESPQDVIDAGNLRPGERARQDTRAKIVLQNRGAVPIRVAPTSSTDLTGENRAVMLRFSDTRGETFRGGLDDLRDGARPVVIGPGERRTIQVEASVPPGGRGWEFGTADIAVEWDVQQVGESLTVEPAGDTGGTS